MRRTKERKYKTDFDEIVDELEGYTKEGILK